MPSRSAKALEQAAHPMKTLAEWLARKPKGPAPKRPLPRVTPKRAKQNREYSVKRKAFLEKWPLCGLGAVRTATWSQDACGNRSCDVHHREGRLNGNYLDESTWIALCRNCHDAVHRHPKEARSLGLLV